MNIQLEPWQWSLLAFVLWLIFGPVLDVLKIVIATFSNFTSNTTGTLKNISRKGRIEILNVDARKIEYAVIKDITKVFGRVKCSLLSWSTNFLRQVVEPETSSEANLEVDTAFLDTSAKQIVGERREKEDTYLYPCDNDIKSIFDKSPENKYAGQQIIGALIGFIALLAFLYADAAQGAQTFKLMFKEGKIPWFLNDIIIPLIMASAGSALILGIFIGDILGLTHLGLFNRKAPKPFIWIISVNLVLSLALSTFIALVRMQLLGTDSESVQTIVNIAQSIVILPMLVTTFLLFRGVSGAYVVLSIILSLLAAPFGLFEFLTRVLIDLIRLGIIGGNFIITRIIWLTVGALELIFLLLELAIKGSFSVITYLLVGLFFIPNLIFRVILRATKQDEFYKEFLANLLANTLQTEVDDGLHPPTTPPSAG